MRRKRGFYFQGCLNFRDSGCAPACKFLYEYRPESAQNHAQ